MSYPMVHLKTAYGLLVRDDGARGKMPLNRDECKRGIYH